MEDDLDGLDGLTAAEAAWKRRLQLLRVLLTRGTMATADVARTLGVDRRRALGDLRALERHGVPIAQRGDGRSTHWALSSTWRFVGMEFGLQERLAVLVGRELVDSFLHDTDFGDAMRKLDAHLDSIDADSHMRIRELARRFICIHEPEKDYRAHRAALDVLVTALLGGYRVRFTYKTASGKETAYQGVAPLTLAIYKRGLYLFFRRQGRYRFYAVERMQDVQGQPHLTYEYPRPSEYDPWAVLGQRYGLTDDGRDPEPVHLRFTAPVKTFVTTRKWSKDQQIVARDDGGVDLLFNSHGNELVSMVLGFGDTVEVLAPPWLRERVVAELRGALQKYGVGS